MINDYFYHIQYFPLQANWGGVNKTVHGDASNSLTIFLNCHKLYICLEKIIVYGNDNMIHTVNGKMPFENNNMQNLFLVQFKLNIAFTVFCMIYVHMKKQHYIKDSGGVASLLFIVAFQVPHCALSLVYNIDEPLLMLTEGLQFEHLFFRSRIYFTSGGNTSNMFQMAIYQNEKEVTDKSMRAVLALLRPCMLFIYQESTN